MVVDITGVLEDGSRRGAKVPTNPRKLITLVKGASVTIRLRALTAGGAPIDMTGATLTLTVKKRSTDGQPAVVKTGTVVALSRADFTLIPGDTKDLAAGYYAYDVWMELGGIRDALIPLSPLVLAPSVMPAP